MDQWPRKGSLPRRMSKALPSSIITPPIPTTGLSGYSRAMPCWTFTQAVGLHWIQAGWLGLTFLAGVYNTPDGKPERLRVRQLESKSEDGSCFAAQNAPQK